MESPSITFVRFSFRRASRFLSTTLLKSKTRLKSQRRCTALSASEDAECASLKQDKPAQQETQQSDKALIRQGFNQTKIRDGSPANLSGRNALETLISYLNDGMPRRLLFIADVFVRRTGRGDSTFRCMSGLASCPPGKTVLLCSVSFASPRTRNRRPCVWTRAAAGSYAAIDLDPP